MKFNLKQISVLLFTVLILFSLFHIHSNKASAVLPEYSGKVEALLPNGERVPLPGIKIFHTDWWRWGYCNQGSRSARTCRIRNEITWELETFTCCFGDQNGVEAVTDINGYYVFDNNGGTATLIPGCTDENLSKKCLAGPKGSNPTLGMVGPNCLLSPNANWCAISCGSNPHHFEPFFPAGYSLPGNLSSLGYTINDGSWDPGFRELSVANNFNFNDADFTFVFLGANPVIDTFDCRAVTPGVAFPSRVPSPTVPWSARLGLADKGGTAGKTNQEFENIIENWRQDKITAAQISSFISNLARVPGLQKTICDPEAEGGCAGPL